MIDFFASQPNYFDHLVPIWHALPIEQRGTFGVSNGTLIHRAQLEGISAQRGLAPKGLLVVAGHSDLVPFKHLPCVLVEHGAGQRYLGVENGSYAGGPGRENVRLFLCPRDDVAQANLERYPQASAQVVGSPILDRVPPVYDETLPPGVSFHWACALAPETRPALPHYQKALRSLDFVGHGHPRTWKRIHHLWWSMGKESEENFAELMDRTSVYVMDNSSTIFEAAALGKPVVLLNAPWYRRDVEHGLRFWSEAEIGIQVDEPWDLEGAIQDALRDERRDLREKVVSRVYPMLDGQASIRAAKAIGEVDVERVAIKLRVPPVNAFPTTRMVRVFGKQKAQEMEKTYEEASLSDRLDMIRNWALMTDQELRHG